MLLIGCGRMGSAMASAWVRVRPVIVHDPGAALPAEVTPLDRIDPDLIPDDVIVVLAVKPQSFGELALQLVPLARRGALFVSIMAGHSLAGIGDALGTSRLVRAMPNLPATIRAGVTVAVATAQVDPDRRQLVSSLFRALGSFHWVNNEDWLDAVTGISGSGPAYFFRFAEALARAGEAAGLPPDLAMTLARETFTGSALLAAHDQRSLADLREDVTSPGGTTAAGLARMDHEHAIDELVTDMVAAATARSRSLRT
ncbi:pyrroline-5-carboxylate reductase [Sandaracinobacter neustonicus]|uniref:pyrroline-5-carboxylate reductase n=1 Tax=Sandaracinobacter neustonicus TaxID=1715348 RepID=UPI001A9C70A5|nr:pyrroline-5-carboxylate reductase [Sandaracinobacter neustonicus]